MKNKVTSKSADFRGVQEPLNRLKESLNKLFNVNHASSMSMF